MQREPMTIKGAEALKLELNELKTVIRPRITAAIAEARAHGDLKENAEYHAARDQQSFAEGRLQEIESKLAAANIIDISKLPQNGKVIFGVKVVLVNVDTDEEVSYQIVGHDEADIKKGLISVKTPISRALIGKEEGEVVQITTPGGVVEYEIAEISYE